MSSLNAEEARIQAAYRRRAGGTASYSWFDAGHLFIVQDVERKMLRSLMRAGMMPLDRKQILEIGCGNGHWLREMIKWGARPEHLTGIDLLDERLAAARRLSPPAVRILRGNAAQLEFADGSFDVVLQATVFTSVLDGSIKQKIAAEMVRVLRPDGVILWYDFRFDNPRNGDVRGIKKSEVAQLFPRCRIELARVTLLPPLTRRLAVFSWLGCQLLSALPWACTHHLGTIRKSPAIVERATA